MGCSCDGLVGNATDENAWGAAFTSYLNGMASGGPSFVGTAQPISWNWWVWSNPQSQSAGLNPDGIRNPDNNTLNVNQQTWWSTLLYGARNVTITTTWNPSDISGLTLSNSNLTATSTANAPQTVRSTTSKSSGTYCWSLTATTITPNWDVGLANASYVLTATNGLGGDTNGLGFDPNSSGAGIQATYYNNASLNSTTGTLSSNGEVVMQCADFGAHLIWSTDAAMVGAMGANSWNNSSSCNPTVAACGVSFSGLTGPYFITFNELDTGGIGILGTTSASLPYSLPAGFSAWDQATTAGTGHPIVQILGANDNGTRFALAR
jgi:hypothetical protein